MSIIDELSYQVCRGIFYTITGHDPNSQPRARKAWNADRKGRKQNNRPSPRRRKGATR